MDVFYSGKGIKVKQLIMFCLSTVLVLISLCLSIVNNTITCWILSLAIALTGVFFNFVLSRICDIRISKENIVIENFYFRSLRFKSDEYGNIEGAFISPPYYRLVLKNGERFIFYDDSINSFSSIFKKAEYSKVMNDQILDIIR